MIYAKDKQTELALEDDWHHNVYDRRYVALVSGEMEEDEGTVANWLKDNKAYITYASDTDNGGKYAVTHFHTLQRTTAHSLVEYKLETGRKNQIRVHTADMGHPVCGDIKYGNGDDPCGRLCLYAYALCFYHPVTHQPMEFETPIPNEFVRATKEDSRPFDERGKKSFKEENRKPFRRRGGMDRFPLLCFCPGRAGNWNRCLEEGCNLYGQDGGGSYSEAVLAAIYWLYLS